MVSNELARRYGSQGIVSTSLNPGMSTSITRLTSHATDPTRIGNLRTELQRHASSLMKVLINWMLYPASFGALTQLWAGTSPEGLQANGKVRSCDH